ncbi:MAG: hypothetical protein NC218_04680 [Acetobacter sp.]|nr:hypothetical protein [Acetobacter sp.]
MNKLSLDQLGRSMIEMLGVLAIVGILSVGGIAGYSKAMQRYKLNKVVDEYQIFMQEYLAYKDDFIQAQKQANESSNLYFVASYLKNMGIVPAGWIVKEVWIQDSVGAMFAPFARKNQGLDIDYQIKRKDAGVDNIELCLTMTNNVFKPLAPMLYSLGTYEESYNDDGGISGASSSLKFYGDSYCDDVEKKCVRSMPIEDIIKACKECAEENSCRWILLFR